MREIFYILIAMFLAMPALAIEEVIEPEPVLMEEVTLDIEEKESFRDRILNKVIGETKIHRFERGPVDSFMWIVAFQGTSDMSFREKDTELRTRYPLVFEVVTVTKFKDKKSEIKLAVAPSRDRAQFRKKKT